MLDRLARLILLSDMLGTVRELRAAGSVFLLQDRFDSWLVCHITSLDGFNRKGKRSRKQMHPAIQNYKPSRIWNAGEAGSRSDAKLLTRSPDGIESGRRVGRVLREIRRRLPSG